MQNSSLPVYIVWGAPVRVISGSFRKAPLVTVYPLPNSSSFFFSFICTRTSGCLFWWDSMFRCFADIQEQLVTRTSRSTPPPLVAADESSTGGDSRTATFKNQNCDAPDTHTHTRTLPSTHCISSTQIFRVAKACPRYVWVKTVWTGHQFITGWNTDKQPSTLTGN